MITQPMMNDAVTGIASPSTASATAANTAVSASMSVRLSVIASTPRTSTDENCAPSPVLVVIAVIMPAAAQTATTGSTPRTPELSAVEQPARGQPATAVQEGQHEGQRGGVDDGPGRTDTEGQQHDDRDQRGEVIPEAGQQLPRRLASRFVGRTPNRRASISTASRMPR